MSLKVSWVADNITFLQILNTGNSVYTYEVR